MYTSSRHRATLAFVRSCVFGHPIKKSNIDSIIAPFLNSCLKTLQLWNTQLYLYCSLYFGLSVVWCWAGWIHWVYLRFFIDDSSFKGIVWHSADIYSLAFLPGVRWEDDMILGTVNRVKQPCSVQSKLNLPAGKSKAHYEWHLRVSRPPPVAWKPPGSQSAGPRNTQTTGVILYLHVGLFFGVESL